ncbi:hypothetical protein ES703_91520 [subsurface metagenome]
MNAMIVRSYAKEDIRMRWQSCGGVGKGSFKEHPSIRKGIDVWSFRILAAITAQPVCSECIYRDEQDIELVFSFWDGAP